MSQTGGTATSGDGSTYDYVSGQPVPYYYYGQPASGYGGAGFGDNACFHLGDSGDAGCSGGITTTYQWQPDYPGELPPKQVLVHESCEAGYGDVDLYAVGQCDDGFGDPEEDLEVDGYPYTCERSKGDHYTVQSGGPLVTVHCSPSATAPSDDFGDSWICWVVYNVDVSPFSAVIDLQGTTKDDSEGDNILIGQHCTASIKDPTYPITGYQWSVSGTTFQSWSPTTPAIAPAPANPNASYEVDGPGPLDQPTANWYWSDLHQSNETVSCDMTMTTPTGSSITVTVSKPVTVYVPDWTGTGTGGYVKVNLYSPSSTYYEIFAGPTAAEVAAGKSGGMNFDASVTSPNPTLFADGVLELVQLVTPSMGFADINGNTHPCQNYGQQGLDTVCPYRWNIEAPDYQTKDSPGFRLYDGFTIVANLDLDFEDYLMYLAPGSGQCVPVARFIWDAHGSATIPTTNHWADYASQNGGSDSAGTVTPSSNLSRFLPYNEFPMWTQINTGSF